MDNFLLLIGGDNPFTEEQKAAAAGACGGALLDQSEYFIGKLPGGFSIPILYEALRIKYGYQPTWQVLGDPTTTPVITEREAVKAERVRLVDEGAELLTTESVDGGWIVHYRPLVDIPNPQGPDDFARERVWKGLEEMLKPLAAGPTEAAIEAEFEAKKSALEEEKEARKAALQAQVDDLFAAAEVKS